MSEQPPVQRYRAVFISDVHLGTRECQAEALLDFIRETECESLYLVGDIVDGWRLKAGWFWPQSHNDVVQKILRLARKGVEVVYIPGNHDEFGRDFCGTHFGGVVVVRDAVHQGADGRRWLVIHGDAFDGVVGGERWRALLGHWAYRALLNADMAWNRLRRRAGRGHWSFAAFLKMRVKSAQVHIARFEEAVAREAARRGCDGVVCGHIHHPADRLIGGIAYVNDGDWVESRTAAVEHFDGRMEIVRRRADPQVRESALAAPAALERTPAQERMR